MPPKDVQAALPAVVPTEAGHGGGFDIDLPMDEKQKNVQYPPFLLKTQEGIIASFREIQRRERERLFTKAGTGNFSPDSGPVDADFQPSRWSMMEGEVVADRNRYQNLSPFAENRICLAVPDGQSDYINASPIKLMPSDETKPPRRYIATQGPLSHTASHMWNMIATSTSNPAVVVMLTRTHDDDDERCFPYFPQEMAYPTLSILAATSDDGLDTDSPSSNEDDKEGEEGKEVEMEGDETSTTSNKEAGTVTLTAIAYDQQSLSTIRELALDLDPTAQALTKSLSTDTTSSTTSHPSKKVWHFLFEGWPDFSIPVDEDRRALLRLLHLTRSKLSIQDVTGSPHASTSSHLEDHTREPESAPLVVHCSAGVGRTGTFIALDFLCSELDAGAFDGLICDDGDVERGGDDGDGGDPIFETVDRLRRQRMMMVEAESQYMFLYDVLRERWMERWMEGKVGGLRREEMEG